MAITAITSFAASPGVTTTAVAWATTAATPTLLVEADMTGGSPILAGRYRSQERHSKSLLSVLADTGAGPGDVTWLAEGIRSQAMELPGATADSHLVPTIAERGQARLLETAWPRIFAALRWLSDDAGTDVVIDLGRAGATGSALEQALSQADTVVVMTLNTLPALVSTVNNLPGLAERARGPLVSTVIVEAAREGFPASSITKQLPVQAAGAIGHNPRAADAYHLGSPARRIHLQRFRSQVATIREELARQLTRHQEVVLGKTTREAAG